MSIVTELSTCDPVTPEKVRARHCDRQAFVYVRQSTLRQVEQNRESTRLQYGLADRACRLGWRHNQVVVIDDDLGRSGASTVDRLGFQRLVAEVGLGHVGLVLGIEVSRLARSCRDWHQLLEMCALFDTLIGDADGIYDPGTYNDRLLLGLKGTMSEAELHILKGQMHEGRQAKARRGELVLGLPRGYVLKPSGEIALDPDDGVRQTIGLVFAVFERRRSVSGVLRYLVDHDIQLPDRVRAGPTKGDVRWNRPNRAPSRPPCWRRSRPRRSRSVCRWLRTSNSNAGSCTTSGNSGWSGPPMRPRWRDAATRASVRTTDWWRARWSGTGMPRSRLRGSSATIIIVPCSTSLND